MQASGARTKKAVVEAGLRLLVKVSFADSNPQTPGQGAMGGRLEWVSFASSPPMTLLGTTVWIDYLGGNSIRIKIDLTGS
jgi:hypothetical protein